MENPKIIVLGNYSPADIPVARFTMWRASVPRLWRITER